MAVPKRVRFEVLRRDGFRCRYCGQPGGENGQGLTVNLVAACGPCNTGKTSTGPSEEVVADVASDAVRWARAMRQAAAEREKDTAELRRITLAVRREWRSTGGPDLPPDWAGTIERFAVAGLPQSELTRMVRVATSKQNIPPNQRWTYFCGCCWNSVKDLARRATEIVDPEPTPTDQQDHLGQWGKLGYAMHAVGYDHDQVTTLLRVLAPFCPAAPVEHAYRGYLDGPATDAENTAWFADNMSEFL